VSAFAQSLGPSSTVLLNLVDVLAIGPRPSSPVEMTLSELWGYECRSLCSALRRAGSELASTIEDQAWAAGIISVHNVADRIVCHCVCYEIRGNRMATRCSVDDRPKPTSSG
jgi:hypothetical protein